MRLYRRNPVQEWTLSTKGINITDNQGKEVVIEFYHDRIQQGDVFYTDSNALEMQRRVLNHRDTWNFTTVLHVTPNYYPVNSAIAIRDENTQMTVMTSRS